MFDNYGFARQRQEVLKDGSYVTNITFPDSVTNEERDLASFTARVKLIHLLCAL